MGLRDDERGQSIQVGAVLLFAVLVVAFSSYQAFVVPSQNEEVEFDHSQKVQGELHDLRNAIVSSAGGGTGRSTSVTLGTQYPSRAVALNPGPPAGRLRTVGTGDSEYEVSIRNAAASGEAGDVWNGTARSYSTGAIVYEPQYNVYADAPATAYEHTALFNEFESDTLVLANQTLVDGRTISIVTVNGSLSRFSTGTTSVDVRPVSTSERIVLVEPADDERPVMINFTSRVDHEWWASHLGGGRVVDVVPVPTDVPGPYHGVSVRLDPDVERPYRLRMARVGLGSGVDDPNPRYVLRHAGGEGPVEPETDRELTVEVRDGYNNPVTGVAVDASARDGSLADGEAETDENGRATFTYTAPADTGSDEVNVSVEPGYAPSQSSFDPENMNTTQFALSVEAAGGGSGGSGGGAFAPAWANPEGVPDNGGAELSACSDESCTWDVGASDDDVLTLESTLAPAYDGVDVDYAVSDSSVGTVSPGSATTGPDGAATTDLTAVEDGTVDVLASASGGSDVVTITVQNTADSGDTQPPAFDYGQAIAQNSDTDQNDIEYVDFSAQVSDDVGVDRVEVAVYNRSGTRIGQETFGPSFSSENVDVTPDQNVNEADNYVDVELTAYDTNGNSRTCTARLSDVGASTATNTDLTCDQTSP